MRRLAAASSLVAAIAIGTMPEAWGQPRRAMAITIDDLPYSPAGTRGYLANAQRGTKELLRVLRAHRVHALGFVTEGKLWPPAEREARIALLRDWVNAGHTLGNHTHSHPDFNRVTIDAFKRDIINGEPVTRRLMAAREPYQRFFRHPMNHSGDTAAKKDAIDRFLAGRGYTIAPHTIENSDFLFNTPYVEGRLSGDDGFMRRVCAVYLDHTIAATAFAERMSMQLFEREIPQTLLIHANDINAGCLDDMLSRFEQRGYRFIALDDAMRDAAYATPDRYVGPSGPTWLFRWAQTLGRNVSFKDDPPVPPMPVRAKGR